MGKRALISVYDKEGIVEFAQRLVRLGWTNLASGGTAKKLEEAGIEVKDVAELVGGGAILGHRVVTLSRELHAGLLADPNNPEHVAEMERLGLPFIDMVVCDFYPLSEAIRKPGSTVESVVEQTDIGGPTMVRSAAKGGRIVVCRPQDRPLVLDQLEKQGDVLPETRQMLRAVAELEVAKYCADSARFHSEGDFEATFHTRVAELQKGENGPQSPARLYRSGGDYPLAPSRFTLVDGQDPSFNNYTDLSRLVGTLTHIGATFHLNMRGRYVYIGVGAKHGNKAGAAVSFSYPAEVVRDMVTGDSLAIFGGVLIFNFPITPELAEIMVTTGMNGGIQKFDCVAAPGFDADVLPLLERKKGKCRLVVNPALATHSHILDTTMLNRQLAGGDMLEQPNYLYVVNFEGPDMKVYGERSISAEMDLALADAVGRMENSNTITIVKNLKVIGNGVGQQARVWAAKLAVMRAEDAGHRKELTDASAYSDSFFPDNDAVEMLIKAGIKAILTTSGSKNDQNVIDLCQREGVLLYMVPDSKGRGFAYHG